MDLKLATIEKENREKLKKAANVEEKKEIEKKI
jgi:hypothetical protein